jgi:predicted alpha-1,2-mannosidase
MKKWYNLTGLAFAILLYSCQNNKRNDADLSFVQYVDPFIGTTQTHMKDRFKDLPGSHFTAANVFPGAKVPWGLTCINPRNTFKSMVGYQYNEPYIYGFSQLMLSGVGCADWGNLLVTPVAGGVKTNVEDRRSTYTDEKASAGYYSVLLTNDSVLTEVTATPRTTLTKYTFNEPLDSLNLIFDLSQAIGISEDAYAKIIDNQEIEGWNMVGRFCGNPKRQKLFFVAKTDAPADAIGVYKDSVAFPGKASIEGEKAGVFLTYDMHKGNELLLKIGLSFVSIENARENLQAEQPGWEFDLVKSRAEQKWEEQLSKIKVYGGSRAHKEIFYTALYRALFHPNVFNDVNGEYLAMGSQQVKNLPEGRKNQYTVFSLWDTYRNLHSLLALVYPEVQSEIVKTMLDMYDESGFLPKWEIAAKETHVMVGDPGSIVVADSYMKGLRDYDVGKAYEAVKKMATSTDSNHIREGIKQYMEFGYIPDDLKGKFNPEDDTSTWPLWGSVSTSLEYYLADYGVAQMAKSLGYDEDYEYFKSRSLGYKKLYNPETGFLQARYADGSWYQPFDPYNYMSEFPGASWPAGGRGFVEGNAWHYLFFVPHDVVGYSKLMGRQKFVETLQFVFEGQRTFELVNEPDIAYPYLFSYIEGEEWRTQQQAREALELHFKNSPDGWPGNDDCGTLSAWFIFTAMGFYPACPGTDEYRIGSPIFDKVVIELDRQYYPGKQFVIETSNNNANHYFIKKLTLNEKEIKPRGILHSEITKGGVLKFEMDSVP